LARTGIIETMDCSILSDLKVDRSTYSVSTLTARSDDKVYWHSRTPHERLKQVEILRRINYGIELPLGFKEFLKLLKENEVRYLLIGGYAVG